LAELDANLELDLDAGEKLELKMAALLLDVLRKVLKVEHIAGTLETFRTILVHQMGDLVVEVIDLAFTKSDELESDADLFLVLVLLLELSSLVLARSQLVL